MNITISRISPVHNKGNLKAFVDINIDGIQLWDCRIVQVSGQRPWLSLPIIETTNPEGKKLYRAAMSLPKQQYEAVRESVLCAWEDLCNGEH